MSRDLLLRKDDITKLTNISFNVDIDKIVPFIYMAQTTKLKGLLGETLYSEILDKYVNDTLEDNYLKLYEDYIVDYLTYYTAYYFWSFGIYQVDNKGVYRTNADDSDVLEEEAVVRVAKMWSQQAEAVRVNMEKFLPEFSTVATESRSTVTNGLNWFLANKKCR
jgi:hypothetical protein